MTVYHAQGIRVEIQDANDALLWHPLQAAKLQEYEVNHRPVVSGHVADSAWQELLADSGARSVRLSVRAYHSDGAADAMVDVAALNRSALTMRFTLSNSRRLEGAFVVTRLQMGGDAEGLEEMAIRFESAGDVVVT